MLPAGYRRLEYLESTGTQWIDTGIKLSSESEVRCKGSLAKQQKNVSFIYGARQSYYVKAFTFLSSDGGNNSRFQFDDQYLNFEKIDGNFEIKQSKNQAFLNGNLLASFQEVTFETPVSAFLFHVNEQYSAGYTPCSCKIYSFSISKNGQLQLNLIPCLDPEGTPCMYDTVSRTALPNQGTGDFLYKLPEVRKLPTGYYPLEYLESTGTQFIDTGVQLSSESTIECSAALVNDSTSSIAVYGSYSAGDKYALFWHLNKQPSGTDSQIVQYRGLLAKNSTTVAEIGKEYLFKQTRGELWIDGKLANTIDTDAFSLDYSAALFCTGHPENGYYGYKSASRVYSFSISRAGEMQVDFQPCLDDKGRPCMYDFVTKKPFYNAATTGGDFVYEVPNIAVAIPMDVDVTATFAKLTDTGVKRLYKMKNTTYATRMQLVDYALRNGFKELVEPPMPTEGYWTPTWRETDTQIICEWVETEEPTTEEI